MADPPSYPDSNGDPGGDSGVGPDRDSPPSTPRWVYAFGIIAIVLFLLFVVLHLTGHGLGGHTLHSASHPLPSSVPEHGVRQP